MNLLFSLLLFTFAGHAETAFIAEGTGIQYKPKYTELAKDLARENARMYAQDRCGQSSEHVQRISEWTYKRQSANAILARATFVCGVIRFVGPNTVGGHVAMAKRVPRRK